MNRRPGRRLVRTLAPMALAATLATAPLLGVSPARAITPQEAAAAGHVPNPAPALARISIDEVTPQVVAGPGAAGQGAVGTEGGVPTVTVSGTVHNVGDTPLEAIDVRLQRGPRATDADSVREPLVWSEPSFPLVGQFQRVVDTLGPADSVRFRVSMPAREVPGGSGPDLQLVERGVYPLLVNVNGTPAGGSPARLDDARTLLPVIDVPEPAASAGVAGPPGNDAEAAPSPVPLTVFWPLAAPPTRVAHLPGDEGTDPVVSLTDETLVRELTEQGRLTGLVRAAADAFDGTGGEELRQATCLAVDPELIGSVSAIADGRQVVIEPTLDEERRGAAVERPRVDGEALAADAGRWLAELRALAGDGCVVTLPGAQADLDAVGRIGDDRLTDAALDREDTVGRVLGVEPAPDVLVPASGTLGPTTADAVGAPHATAVVAAANTRTDTWVVPPPGLVDLAGEDTGRALTFPDAIGFSLAATGAAPENPRYSDPSTRYWLGADSASARLQNARAALVAPVVDALDRADAGVTPGPDDPPDPGVLAVPPQVWTVDEAAAGSLLSTLAGRLDAGHMRPVPLEERLSGPVTVPDGHLATDPTGATDPGAADPFAGDPAGPTEERLSGALAGVGTLRSLVDTSDPRSAVAPGHLDPLVSDALRVLSETGRRADGDGLTAGAQTGATSRVRAADRLVRLEETVTAFLSRVDLLPPGSVFTMASPNSPLLLVARNALPFPVRVTVEVSSPPEFHVDPVGMVQIPAAGSRTLQVPTHSEGEAGDRHTVTFALNGPEGQQLSEPVELSVQSGGYPLAQGFALAAATLALVLGGRRYLRYRRGIHDPADEGHRP